MHCPSPAYSITQHHNFPLTSLHLIYLNSFASPPNWHYETTPSSIAPPDVDSNRDRDQEEELVNRALDLRAEGAAGGVGGGESEEVRLIALLSCVGWGGAYGVRSESYCEVNMND